MMNTKSVAMLMMVMMVLMGMENILVHANHHHHHSPSPSLDFDVYSKSPSPSPDSDVYSVSHAASPKRTTEEAICILDCMIYQCHRDKNLKDRYKLGSCLNDCVNSETCKRKNTSNDVHA
ncbi:PREDICTED: uncharacterized protein LOC104703920 [Camelina sativa]|uniref:Uncharacterized protein LOC104703920 n=1 Tax=Camelina sativa TaxID=90675 RepID=A0ABM0SZB6_CAMSA|nr:PREDICTED: uncharacterized protein LOC104703920 [Camelina sativa]